MLPFCVKSCIDLYKMYRLLCFFLVFGLFAGCRGSSNRHPVPYAPVNETIYLNTPSAYDLQFVGGSFAHSEWGYRGVVVYRRTNFGDANDFGVYDLCCPNHVSHACGTLFLVDNLTAECPCDGQQFLLFDGQALDGSSTWGLRPYQVGYDGVALYISN
jgi:nitrite reductase/ring-hydroxylating ferredoxin subunit